jgi:hypothetical protein
VPQINLTPTQLAILPEALRLALDNDEDLALLGAKGVVDYEGWAGHTRRTVLELWAVLDAVAREHTEAT